MADFITHVSSGSSNTDIKAVASSDSIGPVFVKEFGMTLVAGVMRFWTTFQAQNLTDSEREFREQKRLFEQIPPLLLQQYNGRFVASRNGEIVDLDDDFVILTRRFFQSFGDVPVYITKIGHDEGIFIDTPFFDE